MSYQQTRDILDGVRKAHEHMSEFYHKVSETSKKEKVKMLLDYLSDHEKRLANGIAEFEKMEEESSPQTMNTWFKNSPEDLNEQWKKIPLGDDPLIDNVLDVVWKFDDNLIELYRQAADNAPVEGIQEIFRSLEKSSESDRKKFARVIQGLV